MPAFFIPILNLVIALFLLLMTGFLLRKIKVIDDAGCDFLSKLLVTVGQPMLIIHSLYTAEFSAVNLKSGLLMIVIGTGAHLLATGIALLASKCFRNPNEQKIAAFAMIFGNVGFIGFPVLDVLLPENGRFFGSFFLISFHLTMWSIGVLILSKGNGHIKITKRKLLFNYGTVPCLIGFALYLIFGFLGTLFPSFALPVALTTFTSYLSNMSVPVSLIISGSLLAKRSMKEIFGDPKQYFLVFVKLVAMPLLICALMKASTLFSHDTVLFLTALFACPTAAMVTVISQLSGLDPELGAPAVSLSTVLSVITLPIVMPLASLIVGL